MSYKWKDHYFQKAKELGFKSRAAFKLIEINDKYRLLRKGYKVVDLGAAPGGWLQVATKAVGPKGFVWGVDKISFDLPSKNNFSVIVADIQTEDGLYDIIDTINSKVDVVISDMAPKLSGIRDRDIAKSFELASIALEISNRLLKVGGAFLVKVFQSNELNDFKALLKNRFHDLNLVVPKAKRRASSEAYIIARGFIGKGLS